MTATAKPNPIPDTYGRVNPLPGRAGAAKALDFHAAPQRGHIIPLALGQVSGREPSND
jgi:hypothetical protein